MIYERNYKKEISNRLREERNRLGLNQTEVSSFIEITIRAYHSWENGSTKIPSDKLVLLESLGFDVFYILFGAKPERLQNNSKSQDTTKITTEYPKKELHNQLSQNRESSTDKVSHFYKEKMTKFNS